MKLILTHEVTGLGAAGDVVEVKDGYARNFLFPRGLATAVDQGWPEAGRRHRPRAARSARSRTSTRPRASRASSRRPRSRSRAKSGQSGRLFGAVTNGDIAAAVKAAGGPDARQAQDRGRAGRSRRSAPTRRPSVCTPRSRRPSPSRSSPPDRRGLIGRRAGLRTTRSPALRHARPRRVPISGGPLGGVGTGASARFRRGGWGSGHSSVECSVSDGLRWSRARRGGCRGW